MPKVVRFLAMSMMLCLMVMLLSSCGIIWTRPTSIAKIKSGSTDYLGTEVIVQGEVKEHIMGVPELTEYDGSYRIDDGTDSIIVLARGIPPTRMTMESVKGIAKKVTINNVDDIVIQKLIPMPVVGLLGNTFDHIVAIGVFIVGLLIIVFVYLIACYKMRQNTVGPSQARVDSNSLGAIMCFALIFIIALALPRGYSNIPFVFYGLYFLAAIIIAIVCFAKSSNSRA